jgi:hypothetical protein
LISIRKNIGRKASGIMIHEIRKESVQMPLGYKDLREELDKLLYEMEVPREFFFRLNDLASFIAHNCFNNTGTERALEIIELINPK